MFYEINVDGCVDGLIFVDDVFEVGIYELCFLVGDYFRIIG